MTGDVPEPCESPSLEKLPGEIPSGLQGTAPAMLQRREVSGTAYCALGKRDWHGVKASGGSFYLAREDFGRMFDNPFPASALKKKKFNWRLVRAH